MTEKLTNYDPAEDLTSEEAMAIFMTEALETNDAGYIVHALGVVARAIGITSPYFLTSCLCILSELSIVNSH